jgi:hypothetical protein
LLVAVVWAEGEVVETGEGVTEEVDWGTVAVEVGTFTGGEHFLFVL